MSLICSLLDNIHYLMAKMVLRRWSLMAVKGARTSLLMINIRLCCMSIVKRKFFRVLELFRIIKKRIWNCLSNVIFVLHVDFKSLKQIKLCEGASNIYSYSHTILASSACIYEVNSSHSLFIDPVDYLTHEIYFTNSNEAKLYSCLG